VFQSDRLQELTFYSIFSTRVRAKNEDHVGHIMKEAGDKIVVFGDHNYRYDIPKSKIIAVGRNVILDMDKSDTNKGKRKT
jgi:sporulation protein YlmC with PRC-barrel domain